MLGRYPHRALTLLSRRLGPIYSIRLGRRQAVVVNGRAGVRAAFSTAVPAGRQLDDRPDFELYRHYAGGCSISFGRRGRALRLHRRLARGIIRRLITSGLAEEIVEREAAALVAAWTDDSYHDDDRRLDPADDLTMAVSSAIYSMCYGLDASIANDPEYRQLLKSKNTNGDVFAIGKQVGLWALCREILGLLYPIRFEMRRTNLFVMRKCFVGNFNPCRTVVLLTLKLVTVLQRNLQYN